jgi:hypothetical protein
MRHFDFRYWVHGYVDQGDGDEFSRYTAFLPEGREGLEEGNDIVTTAQGGRSKQL